jgi:hypothetical protein
VKTRDFVRHRKRDPDFVVTAHQRKASGFWHIERPRAVSMQNELALEIDRELGIPECEFGHLGDGRSIDDARQDAVPEGILVEDIGVT